MVYTYNLDPVAITIAGWPVHWYGLMYLANFFLFLYFGWWLYQHYFAVKPKLDWKTWENLIFGGFMAGIAGGRLGYVLFYSENAWISDPLIFLRIWEGGMSIHGGIIGVIVYGLVWCKLKNQTFLRLVDTFILPLCLALVLGRLTNFVNGELFGRINPNGWGVIFPHVDDAIRYPSQIFETGKNALMAVLFSTLIFTKTSFKPGTYLGLFLIGYGVMRFIIEYFRQPEIYVGPLTMGQTLCTIMVLLGFGLITYIYRFNKS